MSKRERPEYFFDDEEEDLDYLINESIEYDKYKEQIIGLDEFIQQKPTAPELETAQDVDVMLEDPFLDNAGVDDFDSIDDDDLFLSKPLTYPSSPQASTSAARRDEGTGSVVEAMDYMDLSSDLGIDDTFEGASYVPVSTIHRKPKINYTEVPNTGAFISAACPSSGASLYFPKYTDVEMRIKKKELMEKAIKRGRRSLLTKPLWQLQEEIAKEERTKLKKIEKEIEEARNKGKKKKLQPKDDSGQLWVDKYRPESYVDLMGDQRVNREVMKWVKQWDQCVFKKKAHQETQRDQQLRQYKNSFGNNPKFAAYKKDIRQSNDPLHRPEKKILLLSGPPGLGKTTLAHVIAKQCGYNIVEVNASDDRTGEVVKSKIKAALEMQAIMRDVSVQEEQRNMNMTQKPNLLIIDEIDGASAGGGSDSFIKQLVQIASVEINAEKKAKHKGQKPLLRPIICICNDAYAPVLRPLRMIAHQVQYKKVPMMTLARRLQDICDNEGLESDLRTLSLLSETTDGDLRSCLNTLQFVRGKSTTFTKDMLDEAGLGKKDMAQSLFSVWEELFSAPNSRFKTSLNKSDLENNRYMDRLTSSIMSNGEIERIMQGCFEAYPMMRYHDVTLNKSCYISEWLHFYDQVNYRTNEKHEYEMYKYLPYPIVNFHRFFAGSTHQEHRVEYPRVEYEVFSTKKSYENLIAIFLAGIHPQKRRFLNRDMIANELVPLLMHVITPDLKPVNQQLIRPAEKAKLARLVDVMIEFGLSFIQEKNEEGQFVFKLEPPVEQLLQYDLSSPKAILPKQYAVRQMIAHEIETEILRRREEASQLRNKDGKNKNKNADTLTADKIKQKISSEKLIALDFFGRPIVPKIDQSPAKSSKMEVDTPPSSVFYRYHEGFSNAVRKPMTVQMFL